MVGDYPVKKLILGENLIEGNKLKDKSYDLNSAVTSAWSFQNLHVLERHFSEKI